MSIGWIAGYRFAADVHRARRTGVCSRRGRPAPVAMSWSPSDWQNCDGRDLEAKPAEEMLSQLRSLPPLVFSGETARLKAALAKAGAGQAFLLHAGDSQTTTTGIDGSSPEAGEGRGLSNTAVEDTFRLLVAQVIVLSYSSGLPMVKVTRLAVNSQSDPMQPVKRYFESAAGLNLLRAVAKSSESMMDWFDFADRQAGPSHNEFLTMIEDALAFVSACGLNVADETFREPEFFTSHQADNLFYEESLARQELIYEANLGEWFGTSAHMLVYDPSSMTENQRTQRETFLSGVENPVGIFVGPDVMPDELIKTIGSINPSNEEGRLVLLIRMGAAALWKNLPPLISAVQASAIPVVWVCDPMNQNIVPVGSRSALPLDLISAEIKAFFSIHAASGSVPGGLHLEMTAAQGVVECVGGMSNLTSPDLSSSTSVPRLNGSQALDIAFETGKALKSHRRCLLR